MRPLSLLKGVPPHTDIVIGNSAPKHTATTTTMWLVLVRSVSPFVLRERDHISYRLSHPRRRRRKLEDEIGGRGYTYSNSSNNFTLINNSSSSIGIGFLRPQQQQQHPCSINHHHKAGGILSLSLYTIRSDMRFIQQTYGWSAETTETQLAVLCTRTQRGKHGSEETPRIDC